MYSNYLERERGIKNNLIKGSNPKCERIKIMKIKLNCGKLKQKK